MTTEDDIRKADRERYLALREEQDSPLAAQILKATDALAADRRELADALAALLNAGWLFRDDGLTSSGPIPVTQIESAVALLIRIRGESA